ncbi:sulfite exporter TauE/SafE family protein [Iodidimonas sp. SYSU 1G8]|uniref:sulfite exporter TauE/SafE family protein n=1 Tax=Iodidimonas sp. SYSU 1G8 TaxID=3133967 RepID=UPI0031FEECBD
MAVQPEILVLIALLAGVGLFGGILSGLLGVGGGIVIVPTLYHIFSYLEIDPSVRMHLAVGTSLATIIPTSIRSVLGHHRRGAVDVPLLKQWSVPLFIGVLMGTAVAVYVRGEALTVVFATVALLVAVQMTFLRHDWKVRDGVPRGVGGALPPVGIGAFSSMMGIGGGTLAVPTLQAFGVPIHRAVATAAGFGLIISVPATIGFIIAGWGNPLLPVLSAGFVSLIGFAIIVPATLLAVPWGVALAHWLKPQPLRWAFAGFLALTSARMYWDLFG